MTSPVIRGRAIVVKATHLKPNPWNPNVMDQEMLDHEMASIREFGFVDPITVRQIGETRGEDDFEIIDGEHRWKCGLREDIWFDDQDERHVRPAMIEFPCWSLGKVDDTTAQQLTIVLNETRGTPNKSKLAGLVEQLASKRSERQLLALLPFSSETLAELSGKRGKIDFSGLQRARQKLEGTERWVERIYRLPRDAAAVLDEAIAKVKTDEQIEQDWRALEMIAADFLGST